MQKTTSPKDRTNFTAKGRFQFMTEAFIRENYVQFTSFQSTSLRKKLPRGIFWIQIERGGLIQWNWILLNSYLVYGLDSPITQKLIEEYQQTLPQSA